MPGKIFISCGQANEKEIKVAKQLAEWLKSENFNPYVAINTQSIQDLNFAIISNLKSADYYIFIDYARERIREDISGKPIFRGSLFTH